MVKTFHISIYCRYVIATCKCDACEYHFYFIIFPWKYIRNCTFVHKRKNTFSLYRISTLLLELIQKLCVFARYDFYLSLLSSRFYCLTPNWLSCALFTLFLCLVPTLWKRMHPSFYIAVKVSQRWVCSSTL